MRQRKERAMGRFYASIYDSRLLGSSLTCSAKISISIPGFLFLLFDMPTKAGRMNVGIIMSDRSPSCADAKQQQKQEQEQKTQEDRDELKLHRST